MITLNEILKNTNLSDENKVLTTYAETFASQYDFNIAITDDVQYAERKFRQCGDGEIYFFPVENYNHGCKLAIGLCLHMKKRKPWLCDSKKSIAQDKPLYFGVQVQLLHAS